MNLLKNEGNEMNQQILNKLRAQAGFGWGVAMGLYTHEASEMWVEYDRAGEETWPSRELMTKFAELIVGECCKIVEPTSHHEAFAQSYMGGVDGLELLEGKVKQIREHFGVGL
jgi:hypothetical protein